MSHDTKVAKITVENKIFTVPVGTRLSDAIRLSLLCGGHGKCGKCRVRVQGGLSPLSNEERQHLTPEEIAEGVRLACRTYVLGDCQVKLPRASDTIKIVGDTMQSVAPHATAYKKYGVAVDLGTTTLAATLYDARGQRSAECGCRNPQISYGADVISRIQAAMDGKAGELARSVREAISELIQSLTRAAHISSTDIDGAVITGNTAMLTLLSERPVFPLSRAPFCASELFGKTISASELGISALSDDTQIYLPPCISAFVGADMVCAILASGMTDSPRPILMADIGTNGEIALWKNGSLQVCSAAAGPAFEGATIKMGMMGEDGAIDRVTPVNGMPSVHVIGGKAPVGICGSGLVDAVAYLLDCQSVDPDGLLESDPAVISSPVVLTQQDIRMVQLAKSAIHAGIVTLLDASGTSAADIDRFYIAGGLGSYLNIHNAARIRLIPTSLAGKAVAVGNAALHGAALLLTDTSLRQKALDLSRSATVQDLAASEVFCNAYIRGMAFPT